MTTSFLEKLQNAQQTNQSWLCLGLDADFDPPFDMAGKHLFGFLCAMIDATADVVSAYKFNLGFFLALDPPDLDMLIRLIQHIPPTIIVILDAKFGDIGSTAEKYTEFAFDRLAVDAVTLSPYVGTDALTPFLRDPTRAIFVLCRTSNLAGNEFQPLEIAGKPLYQHIAAAMTALSATALSHGESGQIGLVVGATQGDDMHAIRLIAPTLPFLVPGIGAQGGDLQMVISYGITTDGIGPLINVGRGILQAAQQDFVQEYFQKGGTRFAEKARQNAILYRDQINALRHL